MPLQAVSTMFCFFLDHIFKLSSKNKTTHKLFSSFKFDLFIGNLQIAHPF